MVHSFQLPTIVSTVQRHKKLPDPQSTILTASHESWTQSTGKNLLDLIQMLPIIPIQLPLGIDSHHHHCWLAISGGGGCRVQKGGAATGFLIVSLQSDFRLSFQRVCLRLRPAASSPLPPGWQCVSISFISAPYTEFYSFLLNRLPAKRCRWIDDEIMQFSGNIRNVVGWADWRTKQQMKMKKKVDNVAKIQSIRIAIISLPINERICCRWGFLGVVKWKKKLDM